jgi:hypothetical protein
MHLDKKGSMGMGDWGCTEIGLPGRMNGVLGELKQHEQGKPDGQAACLVQQVHE